MSETALITGASSGIGEELAELFARDGSHLILVARSIDKLQSLADRLTKTYGVKTLVLGSDLSQPAAAQKLYEAVCATGWTIDCLVNNAGFGGLGYFEEIPLEKHSTMLDVNVRALTELTWCFVRGMIERKRGRVMNVASTASFQPGPNAVVYYASKGYVRYFSEGLQSELSGTGVTVTCLCPGPTKTSFNDVAKMEQTPVFRFNSMDVKPVALAGYRAMRAGRTLVTPGWINKLLQFGSKFYPWAIVKPIMKHIMQPLPPRGTIKPGQTK